jgi:hypothetical protein
LDTIGLRPIYILLTDEIYTPFWNGLSNIHKIRVRVERLSLGSIEKSEAVLDFQRKNVHI